MSQLRYLPLKSGKWELSMGLKPLAIAEWIDIDEHFTYELSLKEKLSSHHRRDVFVSLPGSEVSQQETLALLLEHLSTYFPQHYQLQENQIKDLTTGRVWCINEFRKAPLELAGRLVQEDFLILEFSDKGYILTAASVCFPLRWNLRSKLGLPLAAIHQPVPGYQEKLQRPVDSFFEHIKPNRLFWRSNWSIVETPELFLPPEKEKIREVKITKDNAGENLWLRVERQSLRRLEKSGAVLFTIHSYVYPMYLIKKFPEIASSLAKTLQKIPSQMQIYKNISSIREALLQYLE
ncbi:heme-dependent oxidative N-demethylase family protein [Oscillatoria salina]|uniref:heme-dependent oxidative N-demethylase family protein n=1 Tax=Oscillatoria salina TaxID=331517 RepID=UPI001CCD3E75|nr:DUF3445 domain-containing protein [Oscillatoria salina]